MWLQSNKSPDLVDMSCADSGFLDDGFTMKDYYKPEETFTLPRRAGVEEYKQMPTDEEIDGMQKMYAHCDDVPMLKRNGWVEHTGERPDGSRDERYNHIQCPNGMGWMAFMFKERE